MDEVMRYHVKIFIEGSLWRPRNEDEAAAKAKRTLQQGTFPDVWPESMHVQSVERCFG